MFIGIVRHLPSVVVSFVVGASVVSTRPAQTTMSHFNSKTPKTIYIYFQLHHVRIATSLGVTLKLTGTSST